MRRHHASPARALLFILAAALPLGGCARAIGAGSEDARPVYRINVDNQTGEAMIVSYDEGRGNALLGTVPAGGSDSFVIAAATTTITLTARNVAGTRTLPPIPVQLSATTPQQVQLR
jgi:hypothetical protein